MSPSATVGLTDVYTSNACPWDQFMLVLAPSWDTSVQVKEKNGVGVRLDVWVRWGWGLLTFEHFNVTLGANVDGLVRVTSLDR